LNVFADLHIHSCFSDGTFTPEEIVARARSHDVQALALTDHDSVDGCERMAASCAKLGLEFIPGCELTAEQEHEELHLLAYFMDLTHPLFLERIGQFQVVRQNRVREMVIKLNRLGLPVEVQRVLALANCRAPGRPHVARALVEKGLCGSPDEAFDRFLKRNRPAWVPKFRMSAADGISLIHQAGGLAVLAHPGLNHSDECIPALVEAGLDGMECFHTKHSTSMAEYYLEVADRFGLLVTGGSDCHGLTKNGPLLGTLHLPYQHVERLKQALAQRGRGTPSPAVAPEPAAAPA